MKLKVYNTKNATAMRAGLPTVRFSEKNGLASFSQTAIKNLAITDGIRVEILQNKKAPEDWYIKLSDNDDSAGFQIRLYKNGGAGFNSTTVCRAILMQFGYKETAAFRIASKPIDHDGEQLWLLLTSNPIGAK